MSKRDSVELRTADASCRLWLDGCPSFGGLLCACVGNFCCNDAQSGRTLLDRALAEADRRGFQYLLGPMNRDTWHSYRLVTDSDGSPPFAMEPSNPLFYSAAFTEFDVIAGYSSARTGKLRRRNVDGCGARFKSAGISIRSFDMRRAERDLLAIFQLSLRAFAGNFLYSPIDEATFMDCYRPPLERIDPGLILMAEDTSLQAFLFAIRDDRNVIVKTYASLQRGLGAYLLEQLQSGPAGRFEQIIHALMHDDNVSRRNSDKYAATTFRRYALYGRRT